MNRILCLLLGVGMAVTVPARAQAPVLVPVEAKLTSETKKLGRKRIGSGDSFREKFEITLTVELRNTSQKDSLDQIHLRFVPFLVSPEQTTPPPEPFPDHVQIREYLHLAPAETLNVKFDAIISDYGQKQVDTLDGKSMEAVGIKYAGSVLEVYCGSKLVSVVSDADTSIRKAYEKWAAMQSRLEASE